MSVRRALRAVVCSAGLMLAIGLAACGREAPPGESRTLGPSAQKRAPRPGPSVERPAATPSPASSGTPAGSSSGAPRPEGPTGRSGTLGGGGMAAAGEGEAEGAPPPGDAPFLVDEAAEIGPSGPATATPLGVLMHDREGNLFIARLGPLLGEDRPGSTRIAALPDGVGPFGLGRGPGVFQDHAYWVSRGSLVRRRISTRGAPGPLEILTRDAFDGTRVGTPIEPLGRAASGSAVPATVAYVVRPAKEDAPPSARLWTEGAPAQTLTAEGSSTHSVSLVRTSTGVLAISVQARMAMTPVHARAIRFPAGKPELGDDTVVWVGGGVQPLTEMTLLPLDETRLFGFLPHERSTQEFGIARLELGMQPNMNTRATWLLYPNGIDPAPVAAGELCGEPILLNAEPKTRSPGSGQLLVVRSATGPAGARFRVAEARAIYFASFATLPGGGLATWVADDGVTRAATLRCPKRRK